MLGCRLLALRTRLLTANPPSSTSRYPTAKLAALSHDLAAYYVRREGAVTNFGVTAVKKLWQTCPQTYTPKLRHSLHTAIARLQAIGAAGCVKAGMQQRHLHARAGFVGGPIEVQGVAARMAAATVAGAGPSPDLMRELLRAVSIEYPSKTHVGVVCEPYGAASRSSSRATQVLVLAAMRACSCSCSSSPRGR
jgi:hypothetical protein